ncbi:hypothetical protein ASB1_11700 [Helicobacter heilmannii]|nr:hypothetical protein ASB1_11700 [Helicobacter heilmannii]
MIFPEGTRGRGNEKFLPFKPGARVLAEKLYLKIQPILLLNTRKIFNTKPIESHTTHLRMVLMPAFTPDLSTDWYTKLEQDMQAEYQKHYKELNG